MWINHPAIDASTASLEITITKHSALLQLHRTTTATAIIAATAIDSSNSSVFRIIHDYSDYSQT